jgi:hypothetical protein
MLYSHLCMLHHSYAFKNKLEEAVFNFLKSIDRHLIETGQLSFVLSEIEKKIDELSSQFSRCKPVSFHWSNYEDESKDLHLHLNGGSICVFRMHFIKSIYPSPF